MVPKTMKSTSKNGIKIHSEMGKQIGEKIYPILVALVQNSISPLLYNPLGFVQGMAGKRDIPLSAPQGPGSPVLPEEQSCRPETNTCSLLHQYATKLQLTAPSNLFSTSPSLKAELEQSISHLSRSAFQFTSLSHRDPCRLSSWR